MESFNDIITSDKLNNYIEQSINIKNKKVNYDRKIRAIIKSIDNNVATISFLNSNQEITNVKIRDNLDLKVNDEVYINVINNNLSNLFVDIKINNLEKLFGLDSYRENTLIYDFNTNTNWTENNSIKSNDLIYYKIGKNGLKISESNGLGGSISIYDNTTYSSTPLNLSEFDTTITSTINDYIFISFRINDIDSLTTSNCVDIRFYTTYSSDYFKYTYDKSELSEGWNNLNIIKNNFSETGSPNWSSIERIDFIWSANSGYQDEFITLGCIYLVGTKKFGDVTNGNYTEFQHDGSIKMYGDATIYRDELQSLIEQKLESPSSDIQQDVTEGSLVFKTSATLIDYVIMNVQLNHDWELLSTIFPHIHWWQISSNIPNWLIQYRWQISSQLKTTSWTSLKYSSNTVSYSSGTLNQNTIFSSLTPPVGANISDIVQFRIIRDTNNDSTLFTGLDPESSDIHAINFDVHIKCDTLGSRQLYIK